MPKRDKLSRILLSIAALFLAWTADAAAATLYERSLEKFQVRSEQASPADFTFVVLGDSRRNDGVFKKALALAGGYNPLFILHGGDYSDHGSDPETDHFLAMVHDGVPETPLFVVPGNHEMQRKVFAEKIGPSNFTLDSARLKLRVIALDNADYALKIPELNDLHRQLAAKRENTFVAMHIPPKTERWSWHTFSDGAEELVNALAENGVRAAFYFHVHLYDRDEIKGVLSIITAGAGAPLTKFGFPGEPVYHIVVVRVKNGAVTTEMVKVKEAGIMAIGVDADQYVTYPEVKEALMTSAMKNVDIATGQAVRDFAAGRLTAGIKMATLSNRGVGLAPYHDWDGKIPADCKAKVAAAADAVKADPTITGGK